jgi:hypothetical protein
MNLKAFRNLRVLRPLRTVNAIPSMRRLVQTLVTSLNELLTVAIFICFLFLLFGIIGLQMFHGKMYNSCRLTPSPSLDQNSHLYFWEKVPDDALLCSTNKGGR